MLDIGWAEMILIGTIALLVVGPKDLPRMLHTLGRWTRKLQGMTHELRRGVDDMVRETEFEDLKKDLDRVRRTDWRREMGSYLDPDGQTRETLAEIRESTQRSLDFAEDDPLSDPGISEADDGRPRKTAALNADDRDANDRDAARGDSRGGDKIPGHGPAPTSAPPQDSHYPIESVHDTAPTDSAGTAPSGDTGAPNGRS